MASSLLESYVHFCFHSPVCNVHQHPDLHVCDDDSCPGVLTPAAAERAGLVAEDGSVACPMCSSTTTPKQGKKLAEIHVQLCTDETIHYPEMQRAGKISAEQFKAWRSTLTREELMGYYKRIADVPVFAAFNHDETDLMTTDLPAFNALVQQRIRERANVAVLHSVQHQHVTTKHTIVV